MANIMSMTKLKNKPSRNGFDLSGKNLFTAKVGEALPVGVWETLPGDDFDFDLAYFTRTMPVNTASYTRMREYFDFYFVPTNLMWNKFNTFVTQMVDNNQKATGINGNATLSDEHPYFTFAQIADYINDIGNADKKNFFGFSRAELTCKLLHYLNYGDFSGYIVGRPTADDPFVNAKLNPFPLLAYQKVYQDHIRNSQWEKAYAPAANIDYMSGVAGTNNIPVSEIDKDSENLFDLRYYNWNQDYFMGLLPNSQYGDGASIQMSTLDDIGVTLDTENYTVNPVNGFGLDVDIYGNASEKANYVLGTNPTYSSFRQNVVGFKTDGNGNIIESPVKGASFRASDLYGDEMRRYLGHLLGFQMPGNVAKGVYVKTSDLQSRFSILALRQMEAKQKWAEITQSQQQDYKSQVEAHFGESVSDAYSDRSKYLGGIAGNLDIQPVTNTNLANSAEADIAGRGEGGSRGSIHFESKVHGYIICIYHVVPLLDYAIDGIKRVNLKTSVFDYAIPEFDATGMVSVPMVELTTSYVPGSGVVPEDTMLGYAPRYIDYKTGYDLVHGAFFNGGLEDWVAPVGKEYINQYLTSLGTAVQNGAFNYHFFKVPPSVVNPIFGQDANSSVSTDHFLINSAFDVKVVRNLDRNGLPY